MPRNPRGWRDITQAWRGKAQRNIKKWGVQDTSTIIHCMEEELGEVAKAFLQAEHDGKPRHHILKEVDDLAALCLQIYESEAADD